MKLMGTLVFLAVVAFACAITVEQAWNAYKANPEKNANPSWVENIPDFETFKRRWDKAKAFNAKHSTAEGSWTDYKKTFNLSFPSNEEEWRFDIFKEHWQETIQHNENYALGEIYYPIYSFSSYFHMSAGEFKEHSSKPMH